MTSWVFHATTERSLPSIRRQGLVPRTQPRGHRGEKRVTKRAVIFFAVRLDLAKSWGPIVLRFPWPEDSEPDQYGDTVYTSEYGVVESNWYTRDAVPPEQIEVMTKEGWRPMLGR